MSHLLPQHQYFERTYWFNKLAELLFLPFWGTGLFVLIFRTGFDFFKSFAIFIAVIWFFITLNTRSEHAEDEAVATGLSLGAGIVGVVPALVCKRALRKVTGRGAPKPVTAEVLSDSTTMSGTFAGTFDNDVYVTDPRGATLVLGPPGSGKTSCVIAPTVAVATGPAVITSVKWEVLYDTHQTRSKRGRIWALDLGSGIPDGALRVRWSPAWGVSGWDSARVIANEWTAPYAVGSPNRDWIDSATEWLAVILFAGQYVSLPTFASWCREAESALDQVENTILQHRTDPEDVDAHLALSTLRGIRATPDKERGSIASTLRRLTSVYNSAAVLSNKGEDFDPAQFIRTSDTLYIAASPEERSVAAGLIMALLSAITRERKRASNEGENLDWLNVVVDEAAHVARPPLDSWASQFGGQGIALTVGLQDLSQARAAWPGVNFLGIFPSAILMPGIRDDQTLQTFSAIAGDFDRQVIASSSGTSRPDFWSRSNNVYHSDTQSVHTERTNIVPVEAIAQMPMGEAMLWEGSAWKFIETYPWTSDFFDRYRERVPQQWREVEPPRSLLKNATDRPGDELLREAEQYRAIAEGRDPMHPE